MHDEVLNLIFGQQQDTAQQFFDDQRDILCPGDRQQCDVCISGVLQRSQLAAPYAAWRNAILGRRARRRVQSHQRQLQLNDVVGHLQGLQQFVPGMNVGQRHALRAALQAAMDANDLLDQPPPQPAAAVAAQRANVDAGYASDDGAELPAPAGPVAPAAPAAPAAAGGAAP